jgi:hypothetical protein
MSPCRDWVEPECCTISPQNLTKPNAFQLQHQNGRDSSTLQSTVLTYFEWHGSGSMPKLSIDPNDPGDEAAGFDGAKNRPVSRSMAAEERRTIRSDPLRATFSESGATNRFAEVITSVQFVRVSC